jgi:aminoglycoside phosphotransferase (APT) family kinase protein
MPPDPEERGVLADCLGTRITAMRELPAPRATSYGLRRLAIDLAGGRMLDVLLKSFDVSPHAPDVTLGRGARERYAYETVLAGRELGTARLYGVVWDDGRGRHWLLLEFVGGTKLRHSLGNRIAAAAWLGRLHASVAGQEAELAQHGLLLDYDGAYFRGTADRARLAVGSRFGALVERLKGALVGYEAVAEAMGAARRTLVHGSYRSSNVLIDLRNPAPRVCPVDWELAAIGPPLHDLAFIADGFDRSAVERMCQAYTKEVASAGLPFLGTARMLEEIERLRLHKVLRSLARSADWAYPIETVTKLVAQAEAIRCALR